MTTQQHDEDLARELRELADAVAPRIDVHTAGVVPAARRRRARRRAVTGVGALTAVVVAAGWTVQAQPWAPEPARTAVLQVASSPTPAPTASPTAEAGWPDAPYWYVRSEIASRDSSGQEHVVTSEHWYGHTEPGLWFEDGDTSAPNASGPAGWGRFMVDGVDTLVGWDELYALPTAPARLEQILRGSVEADRGQGTPDDKVAEMALGLIDASPAPPALRDAAWSVITGLPGTTVLDGAADAAGRTGTGASWTVEGTTHRLVYDPDEHRLLERAALRGETVVVQDVTTGDLDVAFRETYLEEHPASAPPIEPTLEMAGCAQWSNC
jgi:hypothetical protein